MRHQTTLSQVWLHNETGGPISFDVIEQMPYLTLMTWWTWVILGLCVFVLELFIPSGFFLFIIGLSGVATGLVVLTGWLPVLWVQWFVCALIAIVLVVGIRKKLMARMHVAGGVSGKKGSVYGDSVTISSEEIAPGNEGAGEMRGSAWTVRNAGPTVLKKGELYKVDSMDGVTLIVKE